MEIDNIVKNYLTDALAAQLFFILRAVSSKNKFARRAFAHAGVK